MAAIDVHEFNTGVVAARQAAEFLVAQLHHYANQTTLLMMAGGSASKVAYWASSELDINTTNSTMLGQIDERYGEVGHDDSNWKQLIESGLNPGIFKNSFEMLKMGTTAQDIAAQYSQTLATMVQETDFSIGVLGVGENGEIAGIKPMDELAFKDTFVNDNYATAYQATDFERITLTARGILSLSQLVVFAEGPEKTEAIANLDRVLPLHENPSQILRSADKVTVFYGKEVS